MGQVPIRSFAIPALGCGLGELHWERVKEIMETNFHDLPNDIHIYQPQ
jgi:O-acetyl-ADP-ribose deacetylase (regulator of RNase III)